MTYGIYLILHTHAFLQNFRVITLWRAGCLSFTPSLEGLKVEVLLLVFWSRVTRDLGHFRCICCQTDFTALATRSFGQALIGALETNAAYAATVSGQPSRLHFFGLYKHDLSQVHIVTRAMQGSHRWFFLFGFLFVSVRFPIGSQPDLTLCSALTCLIVGIHWTAWFSCFGDFLPPASVIFPRNFWGAHRTRWSPWGLGLQSRTPGWWVLFTTTSGVRTLPARGSCLLVGIVPPQREDTSRVTWPSL